jgi:sarcosine oxidase subunit alpha
MPLTTAPRLRRAGGGRRAGRARRRAGGHAGGQRVLLVEQDSLPGGALLREDVRIDGQDGAD